MTPDDPIEVRLTELRATANKYSKAKAQADYLTDFKKSKLALLMQHHERKGVKTAAMQERDARADPAYLELLDGSRVAAELAEALRWELQISMAGIEIWRTRQSTKRAEMQAYK